MKKWYEWLAVVALLGASATDIVPDRVAYFGFGLLVAHWIAGALAGLRDALVAVAHKPPTPFEVDWDTCPSKPIFGEPGFEDETVERYELRLAHYDMRRDSWVLGEARKMVTSSR